ncbi:MAG: HD domain-containing protein [Patescibacteria group bacterium]
MVERATEILATGGEYGSAAADVENVRNLFPEVTAGAERVVCAELDRLPPEVSGCLDDEARQYLTLLEAKDHVWLEHSIGVLQLGAEVFSEFEGDLEVPRDTFLLACALHDVGKLGVPDSVLRVELTSHDFQLRFFLLRQRGGAGASYITRRLQERGLLEPSRGVGDCSVEELQAMHLDYRDYVSLREFYGTNQAGTEEAERYGFDPDTVSFMDVIRRHERLSGELLRYLSRPDREQVALLAGNHHGYSRQPGEQQSVAATVLHLADLYHAITQRRPDDDEHTPIQALSAIVEQAQAGTVDAGIARHWVGSVLANLERQHLRLSVDRGDTERYAAVKQFVGSTPSVTRRAATART